MLVKTLSRQAVTPIASTSAIHLDALGALHLLLMRCSWPLSVHWLTPALFSCMMRSAQTLLLRVPCFLSQIDGPHRGGKEDV
jgi:hypothetical protein